MRAAKEISNVNSFLSPASFWFPEDLVESAWHEHAPFVFWLMENLRPQIFVELGTHHGFSYLAFCQAAKRLGLDTKGYAIDTWRGDEHAGVYGDDVYQKLRKSHDPRYASFSCLVRSTFDDALPHFAEKSIDLLHVDGRHFHDDVEHDFESWKNKLSNRAVVLFHDTNVRERGFGVSRLWTELRQQYRTFEFLHCHGLGVLGIGTELPEKLNQLFQAGTHSGQCAGIRDIYARLGSAIGAQYVLAGQEAALHLQEEDLARMRQRAESAEQQIAALQAEATLLRAAKQDAERGLIAEQMLRHQGSLEIERLIRARDRQEQAGANTERQLTEAHALVGDMQKRLVSSRWLLRAMAGKVIHAPRDISRRIRRSWRKRREILPSNIGQRVGNGFDLHSGQVRVGLKDDLHSLINFEYGGKAAGIGIDLIDSHFLRKASAGWTPRQLTPDLLNAWRDELKSLLLESDSHKNPVISIIIPVHNQIVFTLACVKSILTFGSRYPFEIIIGDDCSSDETYEIFGEYTAGIKYVRHAVNEGFLGNCNLCAAQATGEFLVLLNNDTVVLPGWLDALVDTFRENENIGLVGSRLVYPDGRLQEAGGIIFADGSGHNFGRNGNPSDPRYAYMCDVDYVSGAAIALPVHLWRRLGGFDRRYSPAYYEDTDLAFRIREEGLRVVYQPLSTVVHFEGVSHGVNVNEGTKRYQEINREKFNNRWKNILPSHGHSTSKPISACRTTLGRILIVDAETPYPDRDSGSVDAFNYMKILKRLGFHVSFSSEHQSWDGKYSQDLRALGVEVLFRPFWTSIEQILKASGSSFDFIFLYRAPVAGKLLRLVRRYAPRAKVIFDTVDLHFLRMEREANLKNSPKLSRKAAIMKRVELDVISESDATIVLSTYETELLAKLTPGASVYTIPLVREIAPLVPISLDKRKDIVFIGGFRHQPNVDAVQWFAQEVWPLVRAKDLNAKFIIMGSHVPSEIQALSCSDIEVRGFVADLTEALSRCRVGIAPLRYGAGLKGKVVSCLSQGLPVVASNIAVEGAGLADDVHVLIADNPETMADHIAKLYTDAALWERLSKGGHSFCVENYSLEAAETKLRNLLGDLKDAPRFRGFESQHGLTR